MPSYLFPILTMSLALFVAWLKTVPVTTPTAKLTAMIIAQKCAAPLVERDRQRELQPIDGDVAAHRPGDS